MKPDEVVVEEMTLEQALELVTSKAFVSQFKAATVVGGGSRQVDFYETSEQADAGMPVRSIKTPEKNGDEWMMRAWASAGAKLQRAEHDAGKKDRDQEEEGSTFLTDAFMTFMHRLKSPTFPEENVIALAVVFCEIFQRIEGSAERVLAFVVTYRPEILERVRSKIAA